MYIGPGSIVPGEDRQLSSHRLFLSRIALKKDRLKMLSF
jgi:hypothetical protein